MLLLSMQPHIRTICGTGMSQNCASSLDVAKHHLLKEGVAVAHGVNRQLFVTGQQFLVAAPTADKNVRSSLQEVFEKLSI